MMITQALKKYKKIEKETIITQDIMKLLDYFVGVAYFVEINHEEETSP